MAVAEQPDWIAFNAAVDLVRNAFGWAWSREEAERWLLERVADGSITTKDHERLELVLSAYRADDTDAHLIMNFQRSEFRLSELQNAVPQSDSHKRGPHPGGRPPEHPWEALAATYGAWRTSERLLPTPRQRRKAVERIADKLKIEAP